MAEKIFVNNPNISNTNSLNQSSRSNKTFNLEQSSKLINIDATSLNDLFKRAHSENQRDVLEPVVFENNHNKPPIIPNGLDQERKEDSRLNSLEVKKGPSISDFKNFNKVNDHVIGIKTRSKFLNYKISDIDLRSSSHLNFGDKLEQKRIFRKKNHNIEEIGVQLPTSYSSLDNAYSKNNQFEITTTDSPLSSKINIKNIQKYSIRNFLKSPQSPVAQEYKQFADEKNTSSQIEYNAFDETKTSLNNFSLDEYINNTGLKNTLPIKNSQDDEKNSELLKLNRLKKRFNSIKQRKDKLYSVKSPQSNQSEAMNSAFETQKKLIHNNMNNLYFEKRFSIYKIKSDAIKKNKDVENNVTNLEGQTKYAQDSIEYHSPKETLEESNLVDSRGLIMKVTSTPRETPRYSSKGESNGYHQLVIPTSIGNVNLRSNDNEANFIIESKINNDFFFQELNEDEDGKKSIHFKLENILKERMSSINGKVHEKKPVVNQQLFLNKHETSNEVVNDRIHTYLNSKMTENLEHLKQSSIHSSNSPNFINSAVEQNLNEKKKMPTPYQTLRFSTEDKEELKKRETLINEIKAAVLLRTIEATSKKPQEVYTPHKLLANVDFIDHTHNGIEARNIVSVNSEFSGYSELSENLKSKPDDQLIKTKNANNSFESFVMTHGKKSSTSRVQSPTLVLKMNNFSPSNKSTSPIHSVITSPKQEHLSNHVYSLNESQPDKSVKKVDLRPINKGAVVEMLNFHLLDKNGWDRLDETRRFLSENQFTPQHSNLLDDENNFIKLGTMNDELGHSRHYQSNSPRTFSLTDSELLVGLQISSGETNRSEKNTKSSEVNGGNTESYISKTVTDSRQLLLLENYEINKLDAKNDTSKMVMETKQLLLRENDWSNNNYQKYQFKNTKMVGSQFNSLDTKNVKNTKSRVVNENTYLTKDESKFVQPFSNGFVKSLSSSDLEQKNNPFEIDSKKFLTNKAFIKQHDSAKSPKLVRSNSFIKHFENNEPAKLDNISKNWYENNEKEKPETSYILQKQLANNEPLKINKSYTLPNKFKISDSDKLDKTNKTLKILYDNNDSASQKLYEINNNSSVYESNAKSIANNVEQQYPSFKTQNAFFSDASCNNTWLHQISPDTKRTNENYTTVNIGKVTIPKYLEVDTSTRSTRPTTPTTKTDPLKTQITDDLFEIKMNSANTDPLTNENGLATSKPSTPRKLSLRLKQLFSPTQKRKESLFSSDEDISRRKNINKTGGLGFQSKSPLNKSEDDIYENFISNEEWKGMKDSWKSRAWNAFNPGSLRSKDDLDSFSIKKQPKIRKPLSINTFSQRIRKDKLSVTEIPISFVSKNQAKIDANVESLSIRNNKYKTK
ncbi:metacaspase-2 [Hydra vulgaris]|uniref:metacaspase-2 n=1 Tax=Hydra vulgaris TaxID=6087 RepID=UPI001F5F1BD4|nr:metacaspase-2 [Hydra vulgaris]